MPPLCRLVPVHVLLLAILGATAGCSHGVYRVTSYWGSGIRFGDMGTRYAWAPGGPADFGLAEVPQLDPVLRDLIDQRMRHKDYCRIGGAEDFARVTPDGAQVISADPRPDFLIRYRAGSMIRQPRTGHGAFEEGAVAVDVLDPETGQIIWIGSAEARIDHSMPPNEREKRLRIAIRRILRNFPDCAHTCY